MAASKRASPGPGRKKTAKDPSAKTITAADIVDEQLARYRSMRNFSITEEPSGAERAPSKELPFCVQKHAASHLHYDFRLAWNGVLKSWAIAKGPSYFTGAKRLAVQVEDHPIEYGGFEGIIPKGQYGGGTVMLWDQGTWEPQAAYPDVDAGLRDGNLKFILHGTKLKGKWALIRMGGKWAKEKKPNWLLIKEHDAFEQREDDIPITESEVKSAVTGRTMEEIARNEDHVWNSSRTNSGAKAWSRKESATIEAATHIDLKRWLKGLPKEGQPGFISPQLATMAEVPPSEKGWLHELKLDGYRMQARKDGERVQIFTRTGLDWTKRVPTIAKTIAKLPVENATLDGELVVVAPNGTTSFADLQMSMQEGSGDSLTYFAFDLLHVNGYNTRELALKDRKEMLSEILHGIGTHQLRLSEHIETGGAELLREACKLQAEGIVSKRGAAKYQPGRTTDWIKTKCLHEQEFVVGGYTLPANGIYGVGALLLGYFEGDSLIYAGRTGTGFTQKTHQILRDRLESLAQTKSPFAALSAEARKGARWTAPELVVQVRFATWTADNLVRQAAFLGIREDKGANEVIREEPDQSIGPRRHASKPRNPAKSQGQTSATKSSPRTQTSNSGEHAPVRLTHPDKVLDTSSGMTKQMLADYYWNIAKSLLPQIAGRPVSLVRCPDGIGKPSFFQKHLSAALPKNITGVDVPNRKTGVVERYIQVDTPEALAGLAQLSVLEFHPWGSKSDDLEHPDRLIFDLDPDEDLEWREVANAAEEIRIRLKDLGLESFVKTTGGKGLHVVAPIGATHTWPEVKEFARSLAALIEKTAPHRYLTKMTKSARKGKIYLDFLRNEREATSVAAYSPRARPEAAVSMPLSWAELKQSEVRPVFRVVDFKEWKTRLSKDPWKEMNQIKQSLRI
ncbi:MAG: DNA ligase D [Acidobacteria bacterium]|nr:DNA ligase D [Acidobacteriota bacterium]